MKAVLTGEDSVSNAVSDINSLVPTLRQNTEMLTIKHGTVYEHIKPVKPAKQEEKEVKRPTPFSQDWVVKQVMMETETVEWLCIFDSG